MNFAVVLQTDQKTSDLTDGIMIALTEVFHSCFISEQRAGEKSYVESGYICLSKEQIMNQVPSNLLATFFSGVRAVKKTLAEQVCRFFSSQPSALLLHTISYSAKWSACLSTLSHSSFGVVVVVHAWNPM